jgi:hypothetical protein
MLQIHRPTSVLVKLHPTIPRTCLFHLFLERLVARSAAASLRSILETIFNAFEEDLTTGYFQQDGAGYHISNASMRKF